MKNNRHYLCFNMIGTICCISSSSESQFVNDVSFHDASLRPFHFTHHTKFHVATLGAAGALFASSATTILPSSIHFRPIDAWGNRNDWSHSLPDGENVVSVAVSNYCCAVATDANYLRLYTPSGVQTGIRSIPGPIVTIIGSEELVLVVYHESGVFHGNQSLAYFLIDAETGKRIHLDKLPISPISNLKWLGFSQTGVMDLNCVT
jgi:chromosome transmission fidelity protein 4